MAAKIIVLGAGLVGSAMARDLHASGHAVTVVDLDEMSLGRLSSQNGIDKVKADFIEPSILKGLLEDKDLVVGAAPGSLGYELMKNVITLGKNMVDISFCPEDFLALDPLAKQHGVTVVADMGVAPGMCNAMLGYHDAHMEVDDYKCIVGGLPVTRTWPLEYKSSWSPIDCIEEYTRPARFMRGGKIVTRPALSDPEMVDFDRIGTLEEWNSDGLRSLLSTMKHIPDMVEKTLRYPGTINYLRALRELGYFSYDEIDVDGRPVRPIDLTAKLLFPLWKLEKGEEEFTVMRVQISGSENGRPMRVQYDLYDEYDAATDTLSMARTTGYTCTGVVALLLSGILQRKGVLAPEQVGSVNGAFAFLLDHLAQRGVVYRKSIYTEDA